MIKLVEESLQEMAYPCRKGDGYGMIIEIRSNDHGVLDNANSPAHAHLLDTGKNEVGCFVITSKCPATPNDIKWYRMKGKVAPDGAATRIVRWAKDNKSDPLRQNNWNFLISSWAATRPEK